jgi:LmbE family N-acetylglucosaminyl deacetylase
MQKPHFSSREPDRAPRVDTSAAGRELATSSQTDDERLLGRIVVVSPHLDDAVLSLGATIAGAAEAGARVEVLTVFACEPGSNAPSDDWDRKSGFASEGEAARQRRLEDRTACSILGAIPRWLNFGAQPYDRRATIEEVVAAVAEITNGADAVLIPGFPLEHADHAALSQALLVAGLNCRRLGLYVEQPYAYYRRATPRGPVEAMPALVETAALPWQRAAANFTWQRAAANYTWQGAAATSRHRHLKLRAVKQYQSQLRPLGLRQTGLGHLRVRRMLWREARQGGETIAWPNAT